MRTDKRNELLHISCLFHFLEALFARAHLRSRFLGMASICSGSKGKAGDCIRTNGYESEKGNFDGYGSLSKQRIRASRHGVLTNKHQFLTNTRSKSWIQLLQLYEGMSILIKTLGSLRACLPGLSNPIVKHAQYSRCSCPRLNTVHACKKQNAVV